MNNKEMVVRELIKRGYSIRNGTKVWDVSDSKLWFSTPELSKAFLELKRNSFYKEHVDDREMLLLNGNTKKIVEMLGTKNFNLIEIGCAEGSKAATFIKNLPNNVKIKFYPIDVSSYFIEQVTNKIKNLYSPNVVEIKPFIQGLKNFDDIVTSLRSAEYKQNVILFLGSLLTMGEITDTLFKLSNAMLDGDVLIIGNGIRTGERFAELEKYQDPLFDKWFVNVMKSLGFTESEINYDARFAHGRVEGFYKVKVDKLVGYDSKHINFKPGDEVVIGIHYKYYEHELKELIGLYFKNIEVIKDPTGNHALFICRK